MQRPAAAAVSNLRADMPALANKVYFNYGGQGPLPEASLNAMVRAWRCIQELGPFSGEVFPYREQLISDLREALASLCSVPAERLACTENVTSGCILPLWGLPWQRGDHVLVGDCEHPGVVAACRELARRQGLELSTFPVQDCYEPAAALQRLEAALQPNTRLVVMSHVLWNTGAVMPVAAVGEALKAHPQQPWLLVDGAQSAGCVPLAAAVQAADVYAFTGHKWAVWSGRAWGCCCVGTPAGGGSTHDHGVARPAWIGPGQPRRSPVVLKCSALRGGHQLLPPHGRPAAVACVSEQAGQRGDALADDSGQQPGSLGTPPEAGACGNVATTTAGSGPGELQGARP